MSEPTIDDPRNTGRSQTTAVANYYAGASHERIQAYQHARQHLGNAYNYNGNNNIIQHNGGVYISIKGNINNGNVYISINGNMDNYYGIGVANPRHDVPPSKAIDLPRPRVANPHRDVPPFTAIDLSRPHRSTRSSPPPRLTANYQGAHNYLPVDLCAGYKIKPARFFAKGRVFAILLPSFERRIATDYNGEEEFPRVRQAVVILEGKDSCYALRIRTYGGQGVAKQGVKKSEHAIVYDGRRAPPIPHAGEISKRGEAGMLPIAIKVDVDHDCQLDPRSRVDFGSKIIVERNARVESFGIVNHDSLRALQHQFSLVSGGLTTSGTDLSRGDKHMIACADQKRNVGEDGVDDDDDEDEDEDGEFGVKC